MSRVRNKNTAPEMAVRRVAHSMGFRYRLHRKDLPGSPDLVFPSKRKVIFVHGCFWHGHECKRGKRPSSNQEFWYEKITKNQARDEGAQLKLSQLGWSYLVLWSCDISSVDKLKDTLEAFLSGDNHK